MPPNRLRPTRRLGAASKTALPVLCLVLNPIHASTSVPVLPYFGSLSNFDVVNNTGGETHGFEIELEGLSSKSITFTFGSPYQYRYGTPKKIDYTDSVTGKSGVRIRYESSYDSATASFKQGTPVAPNPTLQTAGHQCWTGGGAGTAGYLSSGCEHFGVGVIGNPTKTTYRWLVADPAVAGNLTYAKDASGNTTQVSIPAPIFVVNAAPQVPPAPPPVAHVPPPVPVAVPPAPIIQAKIEAPEPPPPPPVPEVIPPEFGDAIWVKVFTIESPNPRDLNELLTDSDKVPDPNHPNPVEPPEIEVEWQLLQKTLHPALDEAGKPILKRDQLEDNAVGNPMAAGHESVTRRYEFYEYAGTYDEVHEATPSSDSHPTPSEIGKYIGAQMAALNAFDVDSDGKKDVVDNCLTKPNPDQRDTDGDGYGNACDADLNNDFVVDSQDLNKLKAVFNKTAASSVEAANADLNGDGKVSIADLAILKAYWQQAPGPKAAE
ncbi:MAG: dockerin type I domain-containing protein [Methylococcaceae bacterium]|nr:dockerin type I domain-containing protein [Methylococcaceae bacterium]